MDYIINCDFINSLTPLWGTYLPNGSQIILFGNAKSHKLSENKWSYFSKESIDHDFIYCLPKELPRMKEKKGIDSCSMKIRHGRHLTCG
jgi:hypothetical protein